MAEEYVAKGYKNIFILKGGVEAWKAVGYQLV
jgi:rhodanese-related sulfurtransferase